MDNSLNDMSFEHANNLDYSEFHNVFNQQQKDFILNLLLIIHNSKRTKDQEGLEYLKLIESMLGRLHKDKESYRIQFNNAFESLKIFDGLSIDQKEWIVITFHSMAASAGLPEEFALKNAISLSCGWLGISEDFYIQTVKNEVKRSGHLNDNKLPLNSLTNLTEQQEKINITKSEDTLKNTGESLFTISKSFSDLLLNIYQREPSDFEKHEALIFACVWTIKIVLTSGYNLSSENQTQMFLLLYDEASFEAKMKIVSGNEFPEFYLNRKDLWVKEIKKMNNDGYDFAMILDKLYLAPLSSSFELISNPPNPFEYAKLLSIFSIGLKHYDNSVRQTIDLLLNSTT